MALNEARVCFALGGYHFNPDDITCLLGIEPTYIDAAGTRSGLDKPVISSWELSTNTVDGEVDVFKLMESLIKQLEPVKENIIEVIKRYNLSPRIEVLLVLSAEKDKPKPDVGFGSRTVRFLADIGAFINVDYQFARQ